MTNRYFVGVNDEGEIYFGYGGSRKKDKFDGKMKFVTKKVYLKMRKIFPEAEGPYTKEYPTYEDTWWQVK